MLSSDTRPRTPYPSETSTVSRAEEHATAWHSASLAHMLTICRLPHVQLLCPVTRFFENWLHHDCTVNQQFGGSCASTNASGLYTIGSGGRMPHLAAYVDRDVHDLLKPRSPLRATALACMHFLDTFLVSNGLEFVATERHAVADDGQQHARGSVMTCTTQLLDLSFTRIGREVPGLQCPGVDQQGRESPVARYLANDWSAGRTQSSRSRRSRGPTRAGRSARGRARSRAPECVRQRVCSS